MTVLVADDDALQRETLANALGGWGYDVEAVADGSAAWSRLEAGGVHLVLTDWQMPGLDGAALCRRIRAAAPGRYVCVLLLTAHTDPDGAVRALEAGADDYLAKPVRRSELQARVAAGARVVAQEERLAAQADALAAAHHRLQDDLAAAATLQRRHVLAGRHEADGFAVEGLFRPAATVGGDVFQAARLGDRHLAFYLFDVAGHGVRAAMWAVGAAMALQPGAGLVATADGSPRRPGDVLADLNRHLANDVSDYLTGIYALADLEAGTVTFAQAGHPPPLVVAGGAARPVGGTGLPVGLFAEATYDEHTVEVAPGARFALYSDGIVEHERPDGTAYGLDRLASHLAAGAPMADLYASLWETLTAWGGAPDDDVSVCTLERLD